jgi:WD40 repeat protein
MPDIYNMSDVFISYSRKDSEFVKKLFDDIKATDKEVWADFEDIPKAADWWAEIKAGINAADTFIFVISPDSVQSDICRQEIEHALDMNKRFLPLLHREIIEEADKAKIHSAVSSHNWIFFREGDNYSESFKTLIESVETDLEHNRTLTRLLVRAKEWQDKEKKKSYLLQGEDLEQADTWLSSSMDKIPSPTNLHAEYIKASRQSASNRQRRFLIYVSVGMVLSILLAIFAAFQTNDARIARDQAEVAREQAEVARDQAEDARDQAEESERLARSLALSASSHEALANNNPDLALILASSAVETDSSQQVVTTTLADMAYTPATRTRIETSDVVNTVVYAFDGSILSAGLFDGNICIYEGNNGAEIGCLNRSEGEAAHTDTVLWLHMNKDGTRLLSSGADGKLILWDIETESPDFGTIIKELEIEELTSSVLASDASFALFGTSNGELGYWDFSDNEATYFSFFDEQSAPTAITVIALNNDNSLALSGSNQGSIWVWDIENREFMTEFFNPDNIFEITAVAFSPDDSIVVSGDDNSGISVWNYDFATLIRTYQGHDERVTGITFSEDGRGMFTSSWDNSIIEWDVATGRVVRSFYGHSGGINGLALTGDNLTMVSGGFDSTLRIWNVRSVIYDSQILTNNERIFSADWNNSTIVTAQDDGTVLVFDKPSQELLYTFEHDVRAVSLDLIPESLFFTVLYADCQLAFYTVSGETRWKVQLPIDPDESSCRQVLFRPQNEQILVLSDETLLLVGFDGESIETIPYNPEHSPALLSAAFTPDGNQLLIGENRRSDMLRLIDVATGETIRIYQGHSDGVLTIAVKRDGTGFVSGSFDNSVRLWDIELEDSLLLMEGHSDRILSVDFNPRETHIVSASNDRTMRLWDLETGFAVFTYQGHTQRVINAQFSEDGRRIMTASYDSTLIIWKFPQQLEQLEDWIEENRYIRALSCSEERAYIDSSISCNEQSGN